MEIEQFFENGQALLDALQAELQSYRRVAAEPSDEAYQTWKEARRRVDELSQTVVPLAPRGSKPV